MRSPGSGRCWPTWIWRRGGDGDALYTQRGQAEWLVTVKHAAYLLVVKANPHPARLADWEPRGRPVSAGIFDGTPA